MQQKILQSTGNTRSYKYYLNEGRKIIYRNYPKTPLLKNDDFHPSVNPKVKTLEPKLNLFYSCLKAFLNKFNPKTPLIKSDPYEDGVDFNVYENEDEQHNKRFDMLMRPYTQEQNESLYQDAIKKLKQEGYNVFPEPVYLKTTKKIDADFYLKQGTLEIFIQPKFSEPTKIPLEFLMDSVLKELRFCPPELSQKLKSLSTPDKVKFLNFFAKNLIVHEMQHFKQFCTMLKVIGVEETVQIIKKAPQLYRTKAIDKCYKDYVSENIIETLSEDEKLQAIKQNASKTLSLFLSNAKPFFSNDENKIKLNEVINKCIEIEKSQDLEKTKTVYKEIIADLEQIDSTKEENCLVTKEITKYATRVSQNILDSNRTTKEFFANLVDMSIPKKDCEYEINIDKYREIWNEFKDKPITEEEKKKAYQYKEAFMNYTSLGIDEQAYFSNLLEVEAHTAQAEAAFEKLEEYNKRHEES